MGRSSEPLCKLNFVHQTEVRGEGGSANVIWTELETGPEIEIEAECSTESRSG